MERERGREAWLCPRGNSGAISRGTGVPPPGPTARTPARLLRRLGGCGGGSALRGSPNAISQGTGAPPPGFTARPPARSLHHLGGCGGGRTPACSRAVAAGLPSGKSSEKGEQANPANARKRTPSEREQIAYITQKPWN